ncbi:MULTISPECIES: hypothetical protein, partial [Gammaproteobacteria]|uniref:hypothetical protein n=1 Tax=Gammaproteobacteria TaxID=1236 RepID=UPI0019D05E64
GKKTFCSPPSHRLRGEGMKRDTGRHMSARLLFYDQIINLASPRKIAKDDNIRASTVPVPVLREP